MRLITKTFAILAAGVLFASQVSAADGTAANHIIRNTVTVNFENLAGDQQGPVDDTADVTVQTVQIAPSIAYDSADKVISTLAEGEDVVLTYLVTSNSNGPELYSFSATDGQTTMDADAAFSSVADFTLGATSVAADLTLTTDPLVGNAVTLTVPSDDANDTSVNGLVPGDTIVFNDGTSVVATCTVGPIVDTNGGTPNQTSTIDVYACDSAASVTIGDQVGEQIEINLTVTTDDVTTPPSGTHEITASVDTSASGTAGAATGSPNTDGPLTLTVLASNLQVYKFVRNVDQPGQTGDAGAAAGDELDIDDNGTIDYWSTGITALPGEELEYAVVLVNLGGAIQDAQLTDPVPQFTSFEGMSISVYESVTLDSNDCDSGTSGFACRVTNGFSSPETNSDDTLGTSGDVGGIDGSDTITVTAGVGGDESLLPTDGGGTIASGAVSIVTYRVTVN